MGKVRFLIAIIRGIIPGITESFNNPKIQQDIYRWKSIYRLDELSDKCALLVLLANYPEFRNLYIYRNSSRKIYVRLLRVFYKPMDSLYIYAKEIGGGLFIQHGFATMISAEYIGENCWINQQVTIGYNVQGKAPYIGNNVMITCGAKVLGDIRIGNDVVIGANAVVIRDVESGATMGGVPAKKLK